jgi:hypothetical protein
MRPRNAAIQSSFRHDGHGNHSSFQLRVNFWEADDCTLFGRISEAATAMAIVRAAEDGTGYCVRTDKTTAWDLAMSAPLVGVHGCALLMSVDGVPAAGIVQFGSPRGLLTFVQSFMHEKNSEMERLAAFVQELGVPQVSYDILRAHLAVPRLIHTARTTPPELLEVIDDFDTTLRRLFCSSSCDLTDRGMQQVFLPFAVKGGGFMDLDLRCTLRAAYIASLLDTAESPSMLPGSPAAASFIALALPAFATNLQSFGLADVPDLQPATLHASLGKNPVNNMPGSVQGSRGAVLAVADYFWLSWPLY